VNAARARISKDHNPRRYASHFLLSGLLFCQLCGAPLNGQVIQTPKRKHKGEYYYCARTKSHFDCPARKIPRLILEAEIIKQLDEVALDIGVLLKMQAKIAQRYKQLAAHSATERAALRKSLNVQAKKISNLTEAIGARGHSSALLDALHAAELREAEIKTQLNRLENIAPPEQRPVQKLKEIAEQLKAALHSDDDQTKKRAINMLTARIVVTRDAAEINGTLTYMYAYGEVPPRRDEPNAYEGTPIPFSIPVRVRSA
jgi:hypothetical protein